MIISVCNEKGGSGKTTIALNIAVKLGLLKEDTLLIDADPQMHISELPDSDAGVVPDTFAMRFSRV